MRVLAASSILMLLVVPAWALQEQNIKKVASVNIVLPSGEGCEGKVVKRTPDAYSVKLIAETSVCGDRNDVILIRQARVRSILRDRQLSHPVLRVIAGYLVFSVSTCAASLVAVATGNIVPFLAVFPGGSYLSARTV